MDKKNIKFFDKEEKELFTYLEKSGEKLLSGKNKAKMLNILSSSAKNTFSKKKAVSLRLPERDLNKIKTKAAEEGIPYQTLITSVLHKYVAEKRA